MVYNPGTLLRLREACGEAVGANLDPSHLFWQGIDLEAAIAERGRANAIFHVHVNGTVKQVTISRKGRRIRVLQTLDWSSS